MRQTLACLVTPVTAQLIAEMAEGLLLGPVRAAGMEFLPHKFAVACRSVRQKTKKNPSFHSDSEVFKFDGRMFSTGSARINRRERLCCLKGSNISPWCCRTAKFLAYSRLYKLAHENRFSYHACVVAHLVLLKKEAQAFKMLLCLFKMWIEFLLLASFCTNILVSQLRSGRC